MMMMMMMMKRNVYVNVNDVHLCARIYILILIKQKHNNSSVFFFSNKNDHLESKSNE
jgi:hypothetical protein